MSFSQLPIELLDAICQPLQPADLVSLARTTSVIYPVTQRLLYRHLSISSASHNFNVVVALAAIPELAHHVRTFSLRLESSTLFSAFYKLIATALSHMTELVSLDLFLDPDASWVLSETQCAYPRLLHFASSFNLDDHVVTFLGKTEALSELEVDAFTSLPTLSIPALSIPHLSHFSGPCCAATAIIPGRPVETIHLPSGDLTEADVITLANSTAHVAVLSATSSLPLPLLESLSRRMPHLAYVRIMSTCNFSEVPQPYFYEHIAKVLTTMPDLQGFELAGMHWGSCHNTNATQVVDVDFDVDSSELFLAY